LKWLN